MRQIQKMIERGEKSNLWNFYTKLQIKKNRISVVDIILFQVKDFSLTQRVYELDVKGMYPTIVINNNLSFDTLNCICCKYDQTAQVCQDTINIINQNLEDNKIPRSVSKYWVCKRRKGAFPMVLQQVLSDREKYLQMPNDEKNKPVQNKSF